MSFFEKFFSEPEIEPQRIEDEVFGTLQSDQYGYWHGRLPIDKRTYRLILDGAPEVPNGYQLRHREMIIENWPTIVAYLRHNLFADTDPTNSGKTPAEVFAALHKLVIRIPQDSGFEFDWVIEARNKLDEGDHVFEIHMFGTESKGYSMQG